MPGTPYPRLSRPAVDGRSAGGDHFVHLEIYQIYRLMPGIRLSKDLELKRPKLELGFLTPAGDIITSFTSKPTTTPSCFQGSMICSNGSELPGERPIQHPTMYSGISPEILSAEPKPKPSYRQSGATSNTRKIHLHQLRESYTMSQARRSSPALPRTAKRGLLYPRSNVQ